MNVISRCEMAARHTAARRGSFSGKSETQRLVAARNYSGGQRQKARAGIFPSGPFQTGYRDHSVFEQLLHKAKPVALRSAHARRSERAQGLCCAETNTGFQRGAPRLQSRSVKSAWKG